MNTNPYDRPAPTHLPLLKKKYMQLMMIKIIKKRCRKRIYNFYNIIIIKLIVIKKKNVKIKELIINIKSLCQIFMKEKMMFQF